MTDKQQEVQLAVEHLMRTANRNGIAVCGFIFAAFPPMLTNFGNCSDAHTLRLYEVLVRMCEEKRKAGKVENILVEEVN